MKNEKLFFILFFSLILTSCEQALEKRYYQEVVIEKTRPLMEGTSEDPQAFMRGMPVNDSITASVTQPLLSWQTPQGWQEKPGSAMRLATFAINENGETAECSIVSLGEEAGNLKANVERWAGQVGVAFSSDSELEQFLSKQSRFTTDGGFTAVLVDLSEFKGSSALSIAAGMITFEGHTVFVKLTGPVKILIQNRNQLKSLCKSIKAKK